MRGGAVLLIDGDNVRGKTKFSLSKEDLCAGIERMVEQEELHGRVILFYDHASHQCSYMLNSGLVVVFAGPDYCADDIIARDTDYISEELNSTVVIITDDRELRRRCSKEPKRVLKKKAAAVSSVLNDRHIITSTSFADLLMGSSELSVTTQDGEAVSSQNQTSAVEVLTRPNFKAVMSNMNEEIDLRRRLAQVQTVLSTANRRNKPRMLSREKIMQQRLQGMVSSKSPDTIATLRDIAAVLNISIPQSTDVDSIPHNAILENRFEILSRVLDLLKFDRNHIEDTWERVILAERFRVALESQTSRQHKAPESLFLHSYVNLINSRYSKPKSIAPFVLKTSLPSVQDMSSNTAQVFEIV
jgi:hypothetical protein